MAITANHYLFLSVVLFFLGLTIVAARKEMGIKLLGLGLMFQAINLALVSLAEWFQVWEGQVAVLVVMILSMVVMVLEIGLKAWSTRGGEPK